jgi:hypothetical protein
VVRCRAREEREERSDQRVDGCARRAFVAGFGVPGEHFVEFFEVDVCEVIFETRGYPIVIRAGGIFNVR